MHFAEFYGTNRVQRLSIARILRHVRAPSSQFPTWFQLPRNCPCCHSASRIRFPCHVALKLSSCFELDVLLEAWTLSMFFQGNWWENIILWLIHRDYISQAHNSLIERWKSIISGQYFKKTSKTLRDWKSRHCSRKQSYIVVEKNKKSDLFYNVFFSPYRGPFLLMLFWGSSALVNLILTGNVFPSLLVTYLHALF